MGGRSWDPPPESVTAPDQADEGALMRLELLDGERLVRCWRTGSGFLVMTNLRCVRLWRTHELLAPVEWHEGPSFFFYQLLPPRVLVGRFLELAQPGEAADSSARFLLRDPEAVQAEIEAAMPAGRAEWDRRRTLSLAALRRRSPGSGSAGRVVVRDGANVRCRYCGNLLDAPATVCPSCGAPP
jgi:hypothetical protein